MLKPCNEPQLVIRPKGIHCSKHEAQPPRNDVCLTLYYSEVQLTVPVTTNIDRAVVDNSKVLYPDSQVAPLIAFVIFHRFLV